MQLLGSKPSNGVTLFREPLADMTLREGDLVGLLQLMTCNADVSDWPADTSPFLCGVPRGECKVKALDGNCLETGGLFHLQSRISWLDKSQKQ